MREVLTQRLVKVSAEDRLTDVSRLITENRASHCVVLDQPRGDFLGVVRVRDAVTMPVDRIFADLISPLPVYRVKKDQPPTELAELADQEQWEDAVVLSPSGKFIGLVTRESLCDWRLKERTRQQTSLEKRASLQERSVVRLGRKVRIQAAALKDAISQLEEFSYAVSHDVRTPLRAMRGYAVALQDDYGPRLDETAKDYVQRIIRASHQLDRLTMGVLSYSQISRIEVTIRRLDLNKIVAESVAETKKNSPQAEIQVQMPLEAARGDRALVSQCVGQLLDNAVKFVAKGTLPVVKIWTERLGPDVRLWIEDNGLGIRPEHRGRIFQLFEQVHAQSAAPGIGVGLAIVRRAMEKMEGAVGVEASPEGGSRFWLSLRA